MAVNEAMGVQSVPQRLRNNGGSLIERIELILLVGVDSTCLMTTHLISLQNGGNTRYHSYTICGNLFYKTVLRITENIKF